MAGVKARQAAKVQNGWTNTNATERHFRIAGKIRGKIQAAKLVNVDIWECRVNDPRLVYAGWCIIDTDAMRLVERAVQAREAKRKEK